MREVISLFRLCVVVLGFLALAEQYPKQDAFQNILGHIRPKSSPEVQARAAQDVVARLLGKERSEFFLMTVDPTCGPSGKDTFKISKNAFGKIKITGTSGVAACWGFHYYLKTYCNVHISWDGDQLELPHTLPDVRVEITSNDRFRYYQNVCTVGYSSVWWQWKHWERNIDWMALNGINLALAFNGQEAIWERTYLSFNLTRDEIRSNFGGPAFLPWSRMGNIRSFGGSLSTSWHIHSVTLQHRILQRMRDLGIIPVLPAFAGIVPRQFTRIYPNTTMIKVPSWNRFEDQYCCPYLVDPQNQLFHTIGTAFLKEYIKEFGTDHIYNCDTFNEMEPYSTELSFLGNVGRSVFSAMQSADPNAVWLMQGWLFHHESTFWTAPRVEAFLTSVPKGKMIILDLQSEQFPQYSKFKSYYGHPFIWCMLHNFGGTLGMFGSAQIINRRTFEGRNMEGSTMVGTGLTPEGINQNYVIYDLMNEMAYRRRPVDLDAWFKTYATRRYGAWNEYAVEAWKHLGKTIYNFNGTNRIRGKYVLTRRPSLNFTPWTWYDPEEFFSTWNMFLKARHGRGNSTLYRHDVVDITRQALQLKADELYIHMKDSIEKNNVTAFQSYGNALIDLFDDLEMILASGKNFLLGTWLEDAKNLASNDKERSLYEYNARNQITLWGPRGEIRDYANKQWSGIVADYFKPRWTIFLRAINDSMTQGTRPDISKINEKIFREVERPFTLSRKVYPVTPTGDSIEIALKLISKWHRSSRN